MIPWHGTTIIGVSKNGKTVIAGDGQVSMGQTVMKPNAKKVRRLHDGSVITGFAGATADAGAVFDLLADFLRLFLDLVEDKRDCRLHAPIRIFLTSGRQP